mgnify:CR=1 FL=1
MYYRIINGIAESKQADINGFDGLWAEESEGFTTGDLYDEDNGWSHPVKTSEELEAEAKEWRDGELQSTDYIIPLTDHPDHATTITYRQELRDWPSTENFPNTKPTI